MYIMLAARSFLSRRHQQTEAALIQVVQQHVPVYRNRKEPFMAWRPTTHLIEGEIDNTQLGKVTGWLQFAGIKNPVVLDLVGDFHRDIRGTKILLSGYGRLGCLQGFSTQQIGKVGDMTAGLAPHDYVWRPYFEWYSDQNGRVLLEPEPCQLRIVGTPIAADQAEPISREQQEQNFAEFRREAAQRIQSASTVKSMHRWIA
jgi:hypothetical protein